MPVRRRAPAIVAASLLLTAGCSAGSTPTVAADGTTAAASGTTNQTNGVSIPASVGLTDLARQASEQLRQDRTGVDTGILATDPETWWVTIDVDIPIEEAAIDSPLDALTPPFDQLGPILRQMQVTANAPDQARDIGASLEPPFTGLRARLDGSTQVVTTIPGDEPPPTKTWDIAGARITRLSVSVVDLDAVAWAGDIVAEAGADNLRLGPEGGFIVTTMAEAEAGVPATNPPLTGTSVRLPPSDD